MLISQSARQFKVVLITPSVEFSKGTIPKFESSPSTDVKISSIEIWGFLDTELPKCSNVAASEYVPFGPRKATLIFSSVARQAEMISLKINLI